VSTVNFLVGLIENGTNNSGAGSVGSPRDLYVRRGSEAERYEPSPPISLD